MKGAREKLNSIYIGFALGLAALIGWFAESGTVFVISAIVLICLAVNAGDIRPQSRGKR